jgi:HTH-type transcriptional regulator/antitoxin HigA
MATPTINPERYGELLATVHPGVIKTVEENERVLVEIERLMINEDRSAEEQHLLELLIQLSDDFERHAYKQKAATAPEVIRFLLEQRQQAPKDLWGVIGKSRVSEILSGTRDVTKDQAIRLGKFFGLSPAAFIFPGE